jgi:hypothetical protein
MLNIKGHNLIVIILLTAILTGLAALFLLKSKVGTALAQGGEDSGHKNSNYEDMSNRASIALVAPVEESTITPQSDGSGIEVVSNGAFRNDGDSVDGWFNLFADGHIRNDSAGGACFMAPTYPPNGATLTQFFFSLLDQNPTDNLFIELKRVRFTTGAVDVLAGGTVTWNDTDAVELLFVSGITPGTQVVSSAYAYYVDLCFPPGSSTDILFYGARLIYNP